MSLTTRQKVETLQKALHAKAKRSLEFRFYSLYDKVYREDVLQIAFDRCARNGGAAGVDEQTFEDIEMYGEKRWLGELSEELKEKTYRPRAVRRVWILKANGKQRPLGIPTIRDRVVQMAVVLVLEPIFEADLGSEQFAYRPGKSAHDAIRRVHSLINTGHTEIIDADLSGYFDTIPHSELMKSVSRRVSDKQILHLIKSWLVAPVEETDKRGRRRRTTRNKDEKKGTPQGAPISPLLSNLYMRRFVLGWKTLGFEARFDAHIVNYADDFVICCRGTATEAVAAMARIMGKLKLTINEQKTNVCRMPGDTFDFLGYTIGRCYSTKTGKAYIGTRPSKKKIVALCREISEMTTRRWTQQPVQERVYQINRKLVGWSNYFCLGPVSKAYRAIDQHARRRLRQWLCAKHKVQARGTSRFPDEYLYQRLGLKRLEERTRGFSWANA
jgi:RNA-directed DNA polymerase